jgi:cytoskeletal protein RodZ
VYNKNKKIVKKSPKLKIAAVLLAVVVLIIALLELTNTTHVFHAEKASSPNPTHAVTASPDTKGEPSPSSPVSSSKTSAADSTASNQPLISPQGTFVSNHRPNLSGSPRPNSIQSSCVTTPGVVCLISFTKGSIVKSLPAQKTDGGGGTYWSWKLQDVGITEGTWHISVKATIGSQSKVTEDSIDMVVSP